jgi:DNA helicase II / ATP-dependent DNA helicase PcrA
MKIDNQEIESRIRANLTERQADAALDQARRILCIACAGSGKSRTLAWRITRFLLLGEPAESIVAFTFTDKAAESIKRRVATALVENGLSVNLLGRMFVGTIHGYCQELLGRSDADYRQFDVLDPNRLTLYMMSRFGELALDPLRQMHPQGQAARARYFKTIQEVQRAHAVLVDENISLCQLSQHDLPLATALEKLGSCLQRDKFIDFSTMLRRSVDLLVAGNPGIISAVSHVKHLLVDEYQDVSPVQEQLIQLIDHTAKTLFVVGDDDQSIYGWRGADVSRILTFSVRYPDCTQHVLSTNFRSTEAIVGASAGFAAAQLGAMRLNKAPTAHVNEEPREFGTVFFDERPQEAGWVADKIQQMIGAKIRERNGAIRGLTPADFAILMRSTAQPEPSGAPRHAAYTEALSRVGIPYSLEAGGSPFDRGEVALMRNAFALLRNGSPDRNQLRSFFDTEVQPIFSNAEFDRLAAVYSNWGRLIHGAIDGARRRVFPQQLVFDLLAAFGAEKGALSDEALRDLGRFSRMIQDVEVVFLSVDSAARFQAICNFLDNVAEHGYDLGTDEVTMRPNAVTVATVHKVKGLEFPVVFVVDVENNRFPGTKRAYDGWLPAALIQEALNRGAYVSTPEGEARLFYTALTRAERFLYVTGSRSLPGGKRAYKVSPYVGLLNHTEIVRDTAGSCLELEKHDQLRRVEEDVLPTSFSDVRYYLNCPRDYRFRKAYGFSPAVPEMFGFGRAVHVAVEKLHERFESGAPSREDAREVAAEVFHLKHIAPSRDPENRPGPYERAKEKAQQITASYAHSFAEDFQHRRQIEARFEIPAENCLISGSIDLLVKQDEKNGILEAQVIDFKAIEGGDHPEENMALDWFALSLQVQLYARAAREVLGENAVAGAIHLLKDNQRVDVPIDSDSVASAVQNVEWAVRGILDEDFPMRPDKQKCDSCDFHQICPARREEFHPNRGEPPAVATPGGPQVAAAIGG